MSSICFRSHGRGCCLAAGRIDAQIRPPRVPRAHSLDEAGGRRGVRVRRVRGGTGPAARDGRFRACVGDARERGGRGQGRVGRTRAVGSTASRSRPFRNRTNVRGKRRRAGDRGRLGACENTRRGASTPAHSRNTHLWACAGRASCALLVTRRLARRGLEAPRQFGSSEKTRFPEQYGARRVAVSAAVRLAVSLRDGEEDGENGARAEPREPAARLSDGGEAPAVALTGARACRS